MENTHLIKIDEISKLIKQDYIFIDLREPNQYNKLHIAKFINIPFQKFITKPPTLPKDKPIYLICYSGKRSLYLAKKLSLAGYHAYSFAGGFYTIEHPIKQQFY